MKTACGSNTSNVTMLIIEAFINCKATCLMGIVFDIHPTFWSNYYKFTIFIPQQMQFSYGKKKRD